MAKKTKMPPCGACEVTPEGHDHGTGRTGAEHAGGDDAQRVGRGERDRALGDEGGTEQPGRLAVFAFGGGEAACGQAAVARAIASGGTMPAAMTAAMICHGAWLATAPAPSPATAKE